MRTTLMQTIFFLKSFGLQKENILGINSMDSILKEDHEICLQTVKMCFDNPSKPFKVTLRKPFKDYFKYTEWEFILENDVDGLSPEIVGIGFDKSDFIKNSQNLISNEIENINTKFEALFNTKSLSFVLHKLNGEILMVNQSFYDLIDYENSTHKSNNILHYVPEKFWDNIKETLETLKNTKESSFKQLAIIHSSGFLIDVNVNKLVFKDKNNELLVWSVIRDITERTNHLKELEYQKDLLKQTTEIGEIGGWELDLETKQTIWTDKIYDIYEIENGHNQNLANGISFYEQEDQSLIIDAINKASTTGASFDLEARFISFKNKKKWLRVKGEGVVEDNKVKIVKGILQDITERKNNEETIIKQQNLLKEIYFIQSHTIRLPLANILGLVDLLNFTLTELNEENKAVIEKLKYSANQLDEIIKKIAKTQAEQ
jgi:PAS domain S-box-containing protein